MKHSLVISSLAALVLGVAANSARAQTAPALTPASAPASSFAAFGSRDQAISYAIGLDMVRNFRAQNVTFDIGQLVQGIRDAAAVPPRASMSDEEARILVAELEGQVRQKMMAARRQAADSNLGRTEEFLKQQAAAPGMTATASGLLYRVLRAGQGPFPTNSSVVSVNYAGSLPDGSTFDSSPPGKPAQLKLAALIAGWQETLKLMPSGSKWHVVMPPQLAYGERGAGNVVAPNQALVFDIELLGVQ